jgi:hypothetical protein
MEELSAFVKRAEVNLNDSLDHFEHAPSPLAQEFVELKLQACIFQYDICAEMAGVLRNQPSGFAMSVALKGLVLRLFEYDQVLNKRIIPRMLALAKARGIVIDGSSVRALRKEWKSELVQLGSWHEVRNQAAGHYGQNLVEQVALLKTLTLDSVMFVTRGFLSFNMGLLVLLRDAGKGVASDVEPVHREDEPTSGTRAGRSTTGCP